MKNILLASLCFISVISVCSCSKQKSNNTTSHDEVVKIAEEKERLAMKLKKEVEDLAAKAKLGAENKKRVEEAKEKEIARLAEEAQLKEQTRLKEEQIVLQGKIVAQKVACDKFIGTKYKEFSYLDKTLFQAVVAKADALGISIIHKNGVSFVKYENTSIKIRKACKYDPELAELERQTRLARVKRKSNRALSKKKSSIPRKSLATEKASPSKLLKKTVKKEIIPKAWIKAKAVAVYRGGKDIEITARANVNASIQLTSRRNNRSFNIKAGEKFTYVWRNIHSKSKYRATISAKGKVLDSEGRFKKTGLR